MSELRRRLESLAHRRAASERGADAVLDAARALAAGPRSTRRVPIVVAVAAVALAVLGVGAVLARVGDEAGDRDRVALVDRQPPAGSMAGDGAATALAPAPPATAVPPPSTPAPAKVATLSRALKAARLVSLSSCDELVRVAKAKATEVVTEYGLPGSYGLHPLAMTGGTEQRAALPAVGGGDAGSEAFASKVPGFSGTNIQEAGVDEPDIVKTDGRHLFALAGGALQVVTTTGAPRRIGTLAFDGLYPQELLLAGDRLLVLGTVMPPPPPEPAPGDERAAAPGTSASSVPAWTAPELRVLSVDVSEPARPRVASALTVDGQYVSARLVAGRARIVVRSEPDLRFQGPQDDTPEARSKAKEANRDVVRASSPANWVPAYAVTDGAGRTTATGRLSCQGALRPQRFAGFGLLSVLTVDPARPDGRSSTSVMADGSIVYASTTGLYVATSLWDRVEDSGAGVVRAPDTLIHRFDISSPDMARYTVSGLVTGTVLNQFSLSEHEGHLRVATTGSSPESTESFVTVLGDDGAALREVGKVGGLGRGERIYAVRFLGDVGFVVTFRQTDPLYSLDLSDPRRPRVVGELKIPGFSSYLHPIGDGLLLGVGQDATDDGRRTGAQVSVFDVADLARPRLLHKQSLGSGSSPVEFDHHAFLWWPATGLAVVPVESWTSDGRQEQVGAVGLHAQRAGLREIGRIGHPRTDGEPSYVPGIDRSVVVGEQLFTLSERGVLASDLRSLAQRAWVPYG